MNQFEDQTLPFELGSSNACSSRLHLFQGFELSDALIRLREGIKAYNEKNDVGESILRIQRNNDGSFPETGKKCHARLLRGFSHRRFRELLHQASSPFGEDRTASILQPREAKPAGR